MRNKGFFWFLTILLVAVCLYQLSFTYYALDVERQAEKTATTRAMEAQEQAKSNGNIYVLSSGDTIDFNRPEAMDIAKAAFVNEILKEKSESKVIFGYNYTEVKNRSLAFGLDLVGGMSVTLEISVPELVKSYAQNANDPTFKIPYDQAYRIHTTRGGDFIDLFIQQYEAKNGNRLLVKDLELTEVNELSFNSSNDEVAKYFKDKVASSMDGVEQIMSNRINQFGVAQPNIQKEGGSNRLYIELPGVQDEATVASKLISSANLEFFETYTVEELQGLLSQINVMSKKPEVKISDDELFAATPLTGDAKKDSLNKIADSIAKRKKDSTNLAKAKPAKPTNGKGLLDYLSLGGGAMIGFTSVENQDEVNAILNRADIKALYENPNSNLRFMWSNKAEINKQTKAKVFTLYAVKVPQDGKALVGGSDIKDANRGYDQQANENTVNLQMTLEGQEKWGRMTTDNVGKAVAITMDGVVYSAPNVRNAITSGSTQISGDFKVQDATDLAGILNGGALPAPCVIKDLTKVGPTIGAENSSSGLISFAFAFLAVFIYMYFYYGKGGLVANVALLVNVVLIFGCLSSFGAVLTLAGIAGIVLTIGTAVDANILIFERVKEEKAIGKSTEEAVRIGNAKALPSIIDANMTHLLVAVILKIFGTGEIESFATTLIVGIFTSVFSAIIISKLIITSQLEKGKDVTFGTKFTHHLFSNFHFDWIGKRKYFYIFSIVITIAGVASLFTRKLNPSVEFTGGRMYGVVIEKPGDVDKIEEELAKYFVEEGKSEPASVEVKTKSNDYNLEITTNFKLADDGATPLVEKRLKEGLDNLKSSIGTYKITNFRSISASVSDELWTSATWSISFALVAIFLYIFIRFGQWQYSLGAIVGLAHDVLVVLSVFSLLHGILPFNMDINQAFIAAVLTVIGYSMNDTVIVFDRIRESLNFDKNQHEHKMVINEALNKTLSRTFNTSMILFVVLLIMFIFGGPAIKGFLFALLVGVVIGTYSSLCVATPILIDFTKTFKLKK